MNARVNDKAIEIREHVVSEMAKGNGFEFEPGAKISEMIGTGDVPEEFLETVTFKLEEGREQNPLLYGPLYTTTSDRNLPKLIERTTQGGAAVVFLEHLSGGEVVFGDLEAGETVTVKLHTWAAGLEFDEDFVEYNQIYDVSRNALAFGRAYNDLLNHLHLGPIVSGTYVTTGGGLEAQRAAQAAGTAQLVAFDTDVTTTLKNARKVLPNGSVILYNESDIDLLADAIASDTLVDGSAGSVRRKLSMGNAISYDGVTFTVGGKTYPYPGVTPGTIYIVTPKINFEELVKHDLITDSATGDFSRLILTQLVGRARRGVLAVIGGENGAIKVDISA